MINEDVKKSIKDSVLCWLATSDNEYPNVSPKEIFSYYNDKILIANIASPQSLKNISMNAKVCVSFIDILVQKGWKVNGTAKVIKTGHSDFKEYKDVLEEMTKGLFPFQAIFEITPTRCKEIIAPGYLFYPDKTTELSQIASAKKTYKLDR